MVNLTFEYEASILAITLRLRPTDVAIWALHLVWWHILVSISTLSLPYLNLTEQNPSWEPNIPSLTQEFSNIVWNQRLITVFRRAHLHLQIVTTSRYSAVANSHTQQFITAHAKSSQFVFINSFLVTDLINVFCLRPYCLANIWQQPKLYTCQFYNTYARTT
jgi:hypothetical protein